MANKRWHLAILAAVLLVAAAVVCIVSVNRKTLENIDDSGIRKEWSSGDVKAAEGLVFSYDEYSSSILRWENTITVGKGGEEFSSVHRFDDAQPYKSEQTADLTVSGEYWSGLTEYAEKIAKSLKPGESVNKTLYYREFFENYPIKFNWVVNGDSWAYNPNYYGPENYTELEKLIHSMFVLPVGKEDSIEISVQNDISGNGWNFGSGDTHVTPAWISGFAYGDYMYCVVRYGNGEAMPGGISSGICRFRIRKLDNTVKGANGFYNYVPDSSPEQIWTLPEGGSWLAHSAVNDRSAIFAAYADGTKDYMLVIDTKAGKLQILELREHPEKNSYLTIYINKSNDYAVVSTTEGYYCIFADGAQYSQKFFPAIDILELSDSTKGVPDSFAFDGEKLAVGGIRGGWEYKSGLRVRYTGVYLAVLSESGPLYQAKYGSDSLDAEYYSKDRNQGETRIYACSLTARRDALSW